MGRGVTPKDGDGARPSDRALVSDQAPAGLDASRFDPSRDETVLLVSNADQAHNWRELDDATLGKFARYFIITANRVEQERADKDEWPMLALRAMHGGIALCRMAQETNAGTATWQMDGIRDADGNLGDWKLTAKRVRAPCDRDGSGEAGQTAEQPGPKATARAEGIAQTPPSSPSTGDKAEGA